MLTGPAYLIASSLEYHTKYHTIRFFYNKYVIFGGSDSRQQLFHKTLQIREKQRIYKVFSCFETALPTPATVENMLFFIIYATRCNTKNMPFCYMLFNFSKCLLIFLFCRTDSRSITFLYTVFMILSLAHPPRCNIYWSGTPMACIMDAA